MAEKRKRRVNSPSSLGGNTSKRPRATSPTAPRQGSKPGSPTSEDWKFRLKVISAQNIDDDVFEDAIQGLVKICFPDSILDELGVDVVTRHMDQESAPEVNIRNMQRIFRSAMIKKLASMLAKYLDSPAKFHTAISSVMTAVEELHGYCPPVTLNPEDQLNTKRSSVVATESTGCSTEQDNMRRWKYNKTKDGLSNDLHLQESNDGTSTAFTSRQISVNAPLSKDSNDSQIATVEKVSKSWRWDIDPTTVTLDNVHTHFKKTSDLFAFHALPIVNHELGHETSRKERRKAINSRLAAMSCEELEEWVDSFDRLQKGDLTMLGRVENNISNKSMDRGVTPAPTTVQHHGRRNSGDRTNGDGHSADSRLTDAEKEETGTGPINALDFTNLKTEGVLETTRAFNNTTQHEANSILAATETSITDAVKSCGLTSQPKSVTPLIDLLLGQSDFSRSNAKYITEKFVGEINKRVTAKSVIYRHLDGGVRYLTKAALRRSLRNGMMRSHRTVNTKKICLEMCLQPWAIAHPTVFPELRDFSLFFSHFEPLTTFVLDSILGPHHKSAIMSPPIKNLLLGKLSDRGIPSNIRCGMFMHRLEDWISGILREKWDNNRKRAYIELALREIAFKHKGKFPELSSSSLVRAWGGTTGLKWT